MTDQDADDELLNREIVQLEQQLNDARAKLKSRRVHDAPAAAASAPLRKEAPRASSTSDFTNSYAQQQQLSPQSHP